jgi:serine/threonine protein phosphatase PrpC
MKSKIANKIWSAKAIFSGFPTRNIHARNAFATPKRAFCNLNSEVFGYLESGSFIIPHPDKADKEIEDAVLVKERMIAVAGCVGRNNEHEIDIGKYSKRLIRTVGEIYEEKPNATPKEILLEADSKLIKEEGSSTFVMAIFDPKNKKLVTTMIGDSGYMIVRPERDGYYQNIIYKQVLFDLIFANVNSSNGVFYRSFKQLHSLNCPYQIGGKDDDPNDAIDVVHIIIENDLIVMGSDGFFDNLSDQEIQKIIKEHAYFKGVLKESPQILAENLAKKAEEHRANEIKESLSSKDAGEKIVDPKGRKQDISVIASLIRFNSEKEKYY